MSTAIHTLIPTESSEVNPKRPNTKGQWTSILVSSTEEGGSGGSGENLVVTRNADGTFSGTRSGSSSVSTAQNILASVGLPMPNNIQHNYGADWTVDETSTMEQSISKIMGYDSSSPNSILGDLKNSLVNMAKSTSARKTLKDAGIAADPRKETFYNGPQFRSFPLQWDFSFKNKRETEIFDRMVEDLLAYMHPEFQDGVLAGTWKIPESFKISFPGTKLRKLKDCVLTTLQVDSAASGAGWKSFADDGAASHVSLNMTFMEISPLTREDIRAGF